MSEYQNDDFEDQRLVCFCGASFVWTASEQSFLLDLLDQNKIQEVKTPKRCQSCRNKKRKNNPVT